MVSLTPVEVHGPDMHGFPDEGSYYCVQNAQTGIATGATTNAFADTNPFIAIYNKDVPGGKNIYLDFLALIATAPGTAGTALLAAAQVDLAVDRYSSGGSDLTAAINNVHGGKGNASIAKVRAGNITASAKTAAARMLVGQRLLLPAIPVANDTAILKFGGVDAPLILEKQVNTFSLQQVPKVVIPPLGSCLIHIWLPSQSGAASFIPEMGWVERTGE